MPVCARIAPGLRRMPCLCEWLGRICAAGSDLSHYVGHAQPVGSLPCSIEACVASISFFASRGK
ncbi:protein of unknown function (plasmid) [Cupriavidus taiwanensis]|uniref:Uncharacterized protein n=1 Tax=Cupriavidus taiwanensis TaxID=164546 RepID=A0A375IU46_9BURK|nr:protein of unknown function [Cupriavidus taiwanensis]